MSEPDITDTPAGKTHRRDIHEWFELTYASYLTLNRSLLQSMPTEWQHRFVALLDEMDVEFADIEHARYTVACRDGYGKFIKDPIPHYSRGRTFVKGRTNSPDQRGNR